MDQSKKKAYSNKHLFHSSAQGLVYIVSKNMTNMSSIKLIEVSTLNKFEFLSKTYI